MSFSIEIPENRKYLIIRIKDDFNMQSALEWTVKLNNTIIEQGIDRILIDVRGAKNTLSILENYNYAYDITEKLQLNKRIRGAVLADPGDKSHDFTITAMLNAGYNTRIFHDKPSALIWLDEQVP